MESGEGLSWVIVGEAARLRPTSNESEVHFLLNYKTDRFTGIEDPAPETDVPSNSSQIADSGSVNGFLIRRCEELSKLSIWCICTVCHNILTSQLIQLLLPESSVLIMLKISFTCYFNKYKIIPCCFLNSTCFSVSWCFLS